MSPYQEIKTTQGKMPEELTYPQVRMLQKYALKYLAVQRAHDRLKKNLSGVLKQIGVKIEDYE